MDRIVELESLIKRYATSYYTGISEISDEEFDELVEELRRINPGSDLFDKPGWGYEPKEKVPHLYDLYVGSLGKIHGAVEIPFGDQFYVSPKLDGLSVVSYYINGKRIKAVTRGNGKEGQNVTAKMHVISPRSDEMPNGFTGAIRGEVIIDWASWNELSEKYNLEGNPHANPRNYAAGILNRNTVDEDFKYLSYVPYKIIAEDRDSHVSNLDENDTILSHIGRLARHDLFEIKDPSTIDKKLRKIYDSYLQRYPCDGLVLTTYEVSQDETNEKVNVFHEIAFKFPAESKEVIVTDVTWRATRTGRIHPLIWFNPTSLSGALVSKCTGFNAAFIRDNKINKGTVIKVTRSGEVIPHIQGVVSNTATEGLLPVVCPKCGAELKWSGDDLTCENENESQLAYQFVTTVAPVDGCGWSLYSQYLKLFGIENLDSLVNFIKVARDDADFAYADIYTHFNGAASATSRKLCKITDKLTEAINPDAFLVGCNIKGFSWTSVNALLSIYPEFINDVISQKVDWVKVSTVPRIGYTTVVSLQKFEDRIRELALVCDVKAPEIKEDTPTQFKVAITGSLSMKRADFEKLLSDKGIAIGSNFKEIKYLITNNPGSGSSKMKKAQDNGVEIISESEFTKRYLG